MTKILMVVGSTRNNGFNQQLANKAAELIGDRAEVSFLDFSDVPFMNQDTEFPAPESVTRVREEFKAADGVWFFTPQYNNTYAPYVKNLVDWVSRPLVAGDRSTCVSNGIKATVSCMSGGNSDVKAVSDFNAVLDFVGMNVDKSAEAQLAIPGAAWGTGVVEFDEDLTNGINAQVESFLKFVA